MKCDELKAIKIELNNHGKPIASIQGTISYYGISPNDTFYPQDEVDAAIEELKARIQLDDDEMEGFLQLEEECGGGDLRNYIAELKQKLEDAKASAYTESVDAGMRERKLKRALWLARAERASDKARIFYFAETCGVKLNIDGYSNKEKGHTRMCTARWWRITWLKVERKCRAKAEEYK